MIYDVIVVGAGAAGLMAAGRAAEYGLKVLLLEKNSQPGVKILMSGGTRCNVTHHTDTQGIVDAFGPSGRFLYSALASLTPEDVVDLLADEGVPTQVEATGKIFPVSNRAIDVRDALLRRAIRGGVELALNEPVCAFASMGKPFQVQTNLQTRVANKLIVTTGGQSYPGCGTTGDGYAWARRWGHTIVPPRPALTPIISGAAWVTGLSGITLPDVQLQVPNRSSNGRHVSQRCIRRQSLLFTHFGLSGPAAMDVSGELTRTDRSPPTQITCDFIPSQTEETVRALFTDWARAHPKQTAVTQMMHFVPRRLAEALCPLAGIESEMRGANLSKRQIALLSKQLKSTQIPVAGTRGFKKAEVTAGGIALNEINSSTMGSKCVEGLHFAGEILDLDGPIGGYNFQAAFSTGWLAGTAMGE